MAIRISGLASGLDTESIVQQLVSAYSYKKDTYVKAQTKLSWKQDAWKTLNKKVYSLYSNLTSLQFSAAYSGKITTVSDATKATITASGSAVNGSQSLKISQLAKAGYLTGGKLKATTTENSTLADLGYDVKNGGTINVVSGNKSTDIAVDANTTVSDFVSKLNEAGVKASYDATNQRIFVTATDSGVENDFAITGTDANGTSALNALGLNVKSTANTTMYTAWAAYEIKDAKGNYDAAATQANMESILAALKTAKEAISTAKNNQTQSQAKITKDVAQINYASSFNTLHNANANLSEAEQAELLKLAGMSEADRKKTYETDENGNFKTDADGNYIEADDTVTNKATGADRMAELAEKAGLVVTKDKDAEESTQISVADYATAAAAVEAYEKDETNSDRITEVQNAYESAEGISGLTDRLTQEISDEQSAISGYNNTIKENQATLDKYELLDNGSDAATLEARIKYAVDSLANPQDYNSDATRINGQDSKISLNGAEFTSSSNTYSINGLTIEAMAETGDSEITITTKNDIDGVYNKVKDFIKQYNELINEMTSLYGADSAKGYEPLTTDEKDAMTDTEVEEWEKKIKSSLLRRDDTLGGVMDAMTSAMSKSYSVNGKNYSLGSFGIATLGILGATENEENAYHIAGNADDPASATGKDKLRTMINSDPDSVAEFMKQLTKGLSDALDDKMKRTTLSSAYTVYNDKQMATEYSDYTTTIKKWTEKVSAMEESYYKKFAAMESALATLQGSSSSLSSLLG